jgi:transcriptional regulator with XRE-family HTH domain
MSTVLPPPRLLAAARVLVGLSQRELAAEAGLDRSLIGRYEAGLSMLRADSLGAILVVLKAHGIRFVEDMDGVEMGVLLVRDRKILEGPRPKARKSAARKDT